MWSWDVNSQLPGEDAKCRILVLNMTNCWEFTVSGSGCSEHEEQHVSWSILYTMLTKHHLLSDGTTRHVKTKPPDSSRWLEFLKTCLQDPWRWLAVALSNPSFSGCRGHISAGLKLPNGTGQSWLLRNLKICQALMSKVSELCYKLHKILMKAWRITPEQGLGQKVVWSKITRSDLVKNNKK